MSSTYVEEQYEVAEVIPQVTFALGLGRSVEQIDFDVNAYAEWLRTQGCTDDQIRDTKIHISNRMLPSRYSSLTGEMNIEVTRWSNFNSNLGHESKHRIDHVTRGILQERRHSSLPAISGCY